MTALTRLAIPGEVTRTSLALPKGIDFAAWQAIGEQLTFAEGAVQFWLGDWFAYGESAFGESEAAQAVGRAEETIRAAVWVSKRIPPANRRPNLTWSHHREVAALEPAEQSAVLDLAERDGLTTNALRAIVRHRKASKALGDGEARRVAVEEIVERLETLAARLDPEGRADLAVRLREVANGLERKS